MALIQCPNCGKEISDKAQSCVYCGCTFSQETKKTCPECGNEIDQDVTVCPRCGYPIAFEEEEGVVPIQKNKEKQPKNTKKKRILLSAFMVVLIAVLCFGFAQIKEKEYAVNLYNATYTMLQGCADAENACNLIQKTWSNAIWEKSDKETNKYTKPKGVFVSDFNDALGNLFADEDFKKQLSEIVENQNQVTAYMKALQSPPKKYEKAYNKITEFYETYLQFTNMAINPDGSLNSFAEDFEKIDKKSMKIYEEMQVYIDVK